MALVPLRLVLDHAAENDYGVAALNVNNMEQIQAIMEAANETDSPVIVQATFSAAAVILAESSLSFLGLGPQDSPSWGSLLSQGVNFLGFGPHIAFFPGLFIMLTVLALNLVGDVLRDLLDPKAGSTAVVEQR